MQYLKCVRCGLEIRTRPARVQIENCPRCLARSATMSPMVLTAQALSAAVGWGGRTSEGATVESAATPQGDMRAPSRSAGASRRASQAALAASVRNLRFQTRGRPAG